MKLWAILLFLPLFVYAVDDNFMSAPRMLNIRPQQIRYLPTFSRSSSVRIPNLPLSTLRSGTRLPDGTVFLRKQGPLRARPFTVNSADAKTHPRNNSITTATDKPDRNLPEQQRISLLEVKTAGVTLKETAALPQPNIDSFDEQLETLKDSRVGDDDLYLKANSIQQEFDILRQVERTTMRISSYPPVKTTTVESPVASTEIGQTSTSTIATSTKLELNSPSSAIDITLPSLAPSGLVSSGLAPPSLTSAILIPPSPVALSLSETPLATSVSHIGSFNSSVRREVVPKQMLHPAVKNDPSTVSTNLPNSTSHISVPQLSLTRFIMYPSQAPVEKIVPVPNAAPLPPYPSNIRSGNTTATPSPTDDTLGCTWDFITNSCKDVFGLNWCTRCHDFGNVFLHNCKCLVKNSSPPTATFLS